MSSKRVLRMFITEWHRRFIPGTVTEPCLCVSDRHERGLEMSKAVSGLAVLTVGGRERNLCMRLSYEAMGVSIIIKTQNSVETSGR